jgi:hypothetical protein
MSHEIMNPNISLAPLMDPEAGDLVCIRESSGKATVSLEVVVYSMMHFAALGPQTKRPSGKPRRGCDAIAYTKVLCIKH